MKVFRLFNNLCRLLQSLLNIRHPLFHSSVPIVDTPVSDYHMFVRLLIYSTLLHKSVVSKLFHKRLYLCLTGEAGVSKSVRPSFNYAFNVIMHALYVIP
jgi:hypothetical protein